MFRKDLQLTFFEQHQRYFEGCDACREIGNKANLLEQHKQVEATAQSILDQIKKVGATNNREVILPLTRCEPHQKKAVCVRLNKVLGIDIKTVEKDQIKISWEANNWILYNPPFDLPKPKCNKKIAKLWNQALNDINCDVTVKVKDGILKAHKLILSTFSKQMRGELQSNSVIVMDADKKIGIACLEYIYTDTISNLEEFSVKELCSLLVLSEDKKLKHLPDVCAHHIYKKADPEVKINFISNLRDCRYDKLILTTLHFVEKDSTCMECFKKKGVFQIHRDPFDRLMESATNNNLQKVKNALETYAEYAF